MANCDRLMFACYVITWLVADYDTGPVYKSVDGFVVQRADGMCGIYRPLYYETH